MNETGLEIFELTLIPYNLYNCETWDNIPKEGMILLNKIQLTFLRILLKTPITTPLQSLLWETGTMTMESKIHQRKLTFLHHIINLEDTAIAKKFATIQNKNDFPGLLNECKDLIRKYNLIDYKMESETKFTWKKLLNYILL